MKKKLKLFLSISSLCFALAMLCFGVYSAQAVNYSLGGNVTYTVEDAFVEVQTKLYKSTTNLMHSQLGQKVSDVAGMDFASTPEGLTLVDTSEVYSSTSDVPGTYEKPNLKFSTKAGEECYAYFFVINIKNLSPDINVWAVMEDDLTDPENTVQTNNGCQQTIDQAGKNMVIGLTVEDFTQNIPTETNAFNYGIKIGVGELAIQDFNLAKLAFDLTSDSSAYMVKANRSNMNGVVVIPDTYNDKPVTTIKGNHYPSDSFTFTNFTTIAMSDSIDNIELGYAFYGNQKLTNIIPSKNIKNIGNQLFAYCPKLISIEIPNGVTSIGSNVFDNSPGLRYTDEETGMVYIKNKNSDGTINNHFALIDTVNTTQQTYTINENCKFILNNAFSDCTGLTSIEIPSSIIEIGSKAFENCTALNSITISSGVTSINGSAFDGCTSLQYEDTANGLIYIKGTDSEGNSNNYYAVYDTLNTTQETYKINGNCKLILDNAFSDCTGLYSITIPSSVTSIGIYAFSGCTGLTEVIIQNGVTSIGGGAFNGCTNLTTVTIPSSVISIGGSAFSGCISLTSITIPSSVTSIEGGVFNDCIGLESITVDASNTVYESKGNCLIEKSTNTLIIGCKASVIPTDGSVTSIGDDAFYGSTGLTEVTIPSGVTKVGEFAFYGCTGLSSIEIPSSVTRIEYGAFVNCTGLTEVIIQNGVKSIGRNAFEGCTGITEVTIPSSVTSLGFNAFSGCAGLRSITIPSSVTSIDVCTFSGCTSLTSITIPDSVTIIEGSAFSGCTSLTSIEIPSSVTGIGYNAFSGCTGLTSITIPSSVTVMGYNVFDNCSSLQTINVPFSEGNQPSGWNSNWKGRCGATINYAA